MLKTIDELRAALSGRWPRPGAVLGAAAVALGVAAGLVAAQATEEEPPPAPISLKTVPVPGPAQLAVYVQDKAAAVRLGKALFWDTRVGSDNKTACATCHVHAGADARIRNQLDPGLLGGDKSFQVGGPNHTARASDFPFTRFANVDDVASLVSDRNDVLSSQGVFTANFVDTSWNGRPDRCATVSDAVAHGGSGFNLRGVNTRRVEMSCKNRSFVKVARKLLGTTALADQRIAADDGVLGPLAAARPSYASLVRQAFRPEFWKAATVLDVTPADTRRSRPMDLERSRHSSRGDPYGTRHEVSQMESNFALFFGLAVQLYQATLVSDDAPFDRYAEGRTNALNAQQLRGLAIFRGDAQCIHCHTGAEFTSASVTNLMDEGRLDQRLGDNNAVFRYDNGFFNTGVRPTAEDIGVGGLDPFGLPLSETRLAQDGRFELFGNGFDIVNEVPVAKTAPLAVNGAFKTPDLRNVEFTGPYFHNGGKATLMQVVDFYNRGGDFGAANRPVTDPTIRPLGLAQAQKEDLVAFLLSLSDDRVRYEKAPFDHPSICVPHGHRGDSRGLYVDSRGRAIDEPMCLPAVGANGSMRPLRTFLGLSPFQR